MAALPVQGGVIALRVPCGADDLLLCEAAGQPVAAALALLARLGDEAIDWPGLVVSDFEHLLLQLRVARFGQTMTLGFACPHCRSMAEVSFRVADYLASVKPRVVAGVVPDPARPGWFLLGGAGFRLPTAGDLVAVAGMADPADALAARCLDDAARRPPHRARAERAMAAMAPEISRPVAGHCPACGAAVRAGFSAVRVVVTELVRAAASVHDEVDRIAQAYHWSEAAILALPQERRRAYAERIRHSRPIAA
jgi:hypothetical protein